MPILLDCISPGAAARPGRTYFYQLEEITQSGSETYGPIVIDMGGVGAGGRADITWNSPNPFSNTTEIRFGIPTDGRVQIAAYDVGGRLVDMIADQSLPAGYHSVTWGNSGSLGMGLYFIRLRFGKEEVTHKVVLSR